MRINKLLIQDYIPNYGETGNWKYWKFPFNNFFIALIPQKSLSYSNGSITFNTPFGVVSNKSCVVAMGRWNNQHVWLDGGLLNDNQITLQLGNNYNGTNMTNVLLLGEYK